MREQVPGINIQGCGDPGHDPNAVDLRNRYGLRVLIIVRSTREYVDWGTFPRDKYMKCGSYRNAAMLHENLPRGVYYGTVLEIKYHAKVTNSAGNFWKLFPAPSIPPRSGHPRTSLETENFHFPGSWSSYSRWLLAERAGVLM
jgi:hypothetical protein